MTKLVITRGAPASGKSTWARQWVAEFPDERVRVNRDDLRKMLHDKLSGLTGAQENALTRAQQAQVRAFLKAGIDVVVDDTHTRLSHVTAWESLAREVGAEFEVNESFRDVSLAECGSRNNLRMRQVPYSVIAKMHQRLAQSPRWTPTALDQWVYIPDDSLAEAYLFDIDGTLAHMNGKRGPFEWHNVGLDDPDPAVRDVLLRLGETEAKIILMSGRDGSCREQTEEWLERMYIDYDELLMRAPGDVRKDAVIKLELFREHVAPKYWVKGVFDDRNQVVEMWRRIGLKCYQVQEGDF